MKFQRFKFQSTPKAILNTFLGIMLFLVQTTLLGQSDKQLNVSGIITGEDGFELPYVAVAIHQVSDSSFVTGAATDEVGQFIIPISAGDYYLKIQFLSYKNKIVAPIKVIDKDIDLGKILLIADNASLDEVIVSAERKSMEIRLDKRVFNIDKDPMNKGRNAADILDNLPSVSVDMDGNVSFRGNQQVRILIDGKPSGLVGTSMKDALRQLQGNMIERVEIISNPSARYDAEGEVGIINIVLKKDSKGGLNGSFDVRAGYPEDFGGGFNINYRKGAVNFFASYGIGYNKRPGFGHTYQKFTVGDSTYSYNNDREHARGGWSNNARTGANFYITDNDIITVAGLYSYAYGTNNANVTYTDYNSLQEKTNVTTRTDNEIELKQVIEASLAYQKTFKKKDQEFKFDFQFTDSQDGENSNIEQGSSNPLIEPLFQRVSNTENEQKWLIQADYIHPWGKEGKIEMGAKAMLRNIDNDYSVAQKITGENWLTLDEFDNHMLYTENIYAAYLMAGNKWGKFSAQAGLRFEYSDVTTNLLKTNQINSRQYYNFFPSAHLAYELKDENTLQVSYSRRLNRPEFRWLLPFFGYSDPRNFNSGNPDLNPEYTNSFELGHLKYWKKGSILSSLYYRNTTGKINRILFADTLGNTHRYPVNVGEEHAFGVELSVTYRPWTWWDMSGSINVYRSMTFGEYQNVRYDNETFAGNGMLKSKWTIKKIFHIQLSFNYNSPMKSAQGMDLESYNLDAGLSLDLLKGNGTLTLNARDIFNTRKRGSIVESEGFYSKSEFQWRSRQVTLNFSYRLNQKKPKEKVEKGGGDF